MEGPEEGVRSGKMQTFLKDVKELVTPISFVNYNLIFLQLIALCDFTITFSYFINETCFVKILFAARSAHF